MEIIQSRRKGYLLPAGQEIDAIHLLNRHLLTRHLLSLHLLTIVLYTVNTVHGHNIAYVRLRVSILTYRR